MIYDLLENLDTNNKQYAVFDCDGTLITGDIAHAIGRYQIENKEYKVTKEDFKNKFIELNIPKNIIDNFDINLNFKETVRIVYDISDFSLYNFLYTGYTKEEIYELAKKASKYVEIKPKMKELIEKLNEKNIEVYICSASAKYAVWYISDIFNIKRENVIGVELFENDNGIILPYEYTPKPFKSGKTEFIKKIGYNYPPFLVAGDSDGDYEMMTQLDIKHGMIISPKENSKIIELVDNNKFKIYNY